MDKFVDAIVASAMDIEDLATQGHKRAVCPYYAAREAVLKADLVLVPYSCLIHRCASVGMRARETNRS
jgi:chromosome transmission fidelity protein 1